MNVSYSKVELYSSCPYKYYLSYVERWQADKTFTSLLFGSAMDATLNYILTRTKRHHPVYPSTAEKIFSKYMDAWHGQNELSYFKNECPVTDPVSDALFEDLDERARQWAVHNHLLNIGEKMIATYITNILPQFKRIISVQQKKYIPNEAGDNLVLITDFKAEMHDGRIVLFDNKTSSDIKKYYGPSCVKKSNQLAIYTEYEDSKLGGYVALQKKLVDDTIKYDIIIDTVPEEKAAEVFTAIDGALTSMKVEEFPKNEKSCWSFGRPCEFWGLCKNGSSKGLVKR